MANQLFTFADMAGRICEQDGRNDFKTVKEQLRGFNQRGLLTGADHGGPRGAVRVTLFEFCRARLLLVLLDLGVRSDDLARANVMLDDGGRTTLPDGSIIEHSLAAVFAGVRKGEGWVLRAGMFADESGVRFSTKLLRDWQANRPFTSTNPDGDPMLEGSEPSVRAFTVYSQVKIPAYDLLEPLLRDA